MTDVLDTTKLDALIAQSPEKVDKAVRATAFEVQGVAVGLAAVDTGAMRSSIFVKTSKESTAEQALPAAQALNPAAQVEDPTPPGTPPLMTAYVAPGVDYAGYVEFGTSRQAAQPFLTPAAEKADEFFSKNIKVVFNE